MAQETPQPLPPEHVDALNNVDLQMAFGTHGYQDSHKEHGTVLLGVTDRHYDGMENFVQDLSAQRGDVLAIEGIGYDEQWSRDYLLRAMSRIDRFSPYLQTKAFEGLDGLEPEAVARYFRLARDLQILSPIDYAMGRATEKGVRVVHADADYDSLAGWELENWGEKNTDFRNGHMVLSLGRIAVGMAPGNERPQLKFVSGSDHRRGIERLLDDAGVRYSSTSFGPSRRIREGLTDMQIRGHMVAPRLVPSPRGRDIAAWERNLRSKLDH